MPRCRLLGRASGNPPFPILVAPVESSSPWSPGSISAVARQPTDIPVGSQFSPDVIHLPSFVRAAVAAMPAATSGAVAGTRAAKQQAKRAMEAAAWQAGVRVKAKAGPPTRRNRALPVEAARQYGLLDGQYRVTPLTQRLATLASHHVLEEFARHILLHRRGLRVVEAAEQMALEGRKVTGDLLAQELNAQGVRVGVHNTAINAIRMWLAAAGVFDQQDIWRVHQARKQALLGLSNTQIAALVGLNDDQLAFVEALCRLNPSGPVRGADVRAMAESLRGRVLDRGNLPNVFLDPLKRAGLIDFQTRGTQGGKSATLWTTAAFRRDVLEPFITDTVKTLDAPLTAYFTKRPADIYADLRSSDTFTKGQALEAFAVFVMRLLGLRFAAWRKRARDTTGRAEIDVLMTGLSGVLPALWQIQCKNTPAGQVSLEDVAKEVGLLPITKATHILLLANCPVSGDARDYATKIMQDSATIIFLLDRADFARIEANHAEIFAILRAQADEITAIRYREATRVLGARATVG